MARQERGFCIIITYGWESASPSLGMTVRQASSLQLRGVLEQSFPLVITGFDGLEPSAASGFRELHRSPVQGISHDLLPLRRVNPWIVPLCPSLQPQLGFLRPLEHLQPHQTAHNSPDSSCSVIIWLLTLLFPLPASFLPHPPPNSFPGPSPSSSKSGHRCPLLQDAFPPPSPEGWCPSLCSHLRFLQQGFPCFIL